MVNFLTKSFTKIMDKLTWIGLIMGGIFGLVSSVSVSGSAAMCIFCTALGVFFAFIAELIIVPPLMILFSIDSKLDDIKEILKKEN